MTQTHSGPVIRLSRILDPKAGRAAVVAFDHGLHLGSIPGTQDPAHTLHTLRDAGADAFLVSPGIVRAFPEVFMGRGAPGLILRADWTNRWRDADMLGHAEGRGTLIASAEDAARLGADAVLVYLFIGYGDPAVEARQVEQVAALTQRCAALGLGCIIEPMPRGHLVGDDSYHAPYVALGARMACELGADLLKTDYTGSADSFAQVIAASFRPVLIAGGPKTANQREALAMVRGAIDAGARGMFIGRNVFQAEDPARMMAVMRAIIHEDLSVDDALARLEA